MKLIFSCMSEGYAEPCSHPLSPTPIHSHLFPIIFNPLSLIFSSLLPTLTNSKATFIHTHPHVYMLNVCTSTCTAHFYKLNVITLMLLTCLSALHSYLLHVPACAYMSSCFTCLWALHVSFCKIFIYTKICCVHIIYIYNYVLIFSFWNYRNTSSRQLVS